MRLLLFLAWRSLFSSRVTVVLLVLSIAVGAGFQVANTSNLDALDSALIEEGLTRGTGDIRVEPRDASRFREGDKMATGLRAVPGVRDTLAVLVYAGAVGKSGKRFLGAPIYATAETATPPYHVVEGAPLAPGDRDGILLGTSLAKRLGAKPGDDIETRVIFGAVGVAIDDDNVGRYTLKLRGIAAGSAGAHRFAFVDRSFLAKESGEPNGASAILVHTYDHEAAAAIAARMNAAFADIEAIGWREDDPYLPNYLAANRTIAAVSYAMVVAAVSVPMWALLYIHVLKRRREIGILAAIGFSRRDVFAIYLLQALFVSILGCAIGVAIGYGLIAYFNNHPLFEWDSLVVRPIASLHAFLGPAIVITVTALVAGSYPAWRAARTDPAQVLRRLRLTIVSVSELRRTFAKRNVVDGVALAIAPGEKVALMGPSGCGKTTLLQMIGLLDRPDGGRVTFGDADPWSASAGQRARMRLSSIGFVFQHSNLIGHLTARENVAIPMWRAGGGRAAAMIRATELLAPMGLAGRIDARASELSIGEAQRVAVARALVNRPKLVLADEPTGSLDAAAAEGVLGALLGAADAALLVVTHDPEVAARAGRTLRMRDGKLASA